MSNRFSVARACALALACVLAAPFAAPTFAAETAAPKPAAKPAATTAKKAPAKSKAPRVPTKTPASAAVDTIATVLGTGMTRADLGRPPQAIVESAKGDSAKQAQLTRAWESQAFTGFVLGVLLDKWAVEQKIQAEPAEVSAMLALAQKAAQEPEAKERGLMIPDTTNASVRKASAGAVARFKLNAALHKKYGGRVLVDPQAGPMPFDAYKRFLEAQQKAGAFAVRADWNTRFWAAFDSTEGKTFLAEPEASQTIRRPWWNE